MRVKITVVTKHRPNEQIRSILAVKFHPFFLVKRIVKTDWYVDCNLQVYTKPFSMLPLSAVEKPGNLYVGLFAASFRFPKIHKEQTLKENTSAHLNLLLLKLALKDPA